MSGCLRWFGILLITAAVCLLCIGGIEAADWLSRVAPAAGFIGMSGEALMKALSHFAIYVFVTIPMFVIGFLAVRAGRRRSPTAADQKPK